MFEWLFKYPLQEFHRGELDFYAAPRLDLLLLGLAVIAAFAWLTYRRQAAALSPLRRWSLILLRTLGLALLCIALLRPMLKLKKGDENRRIVAIAVDVSQSMAQDAGPNSPTRFDRVRQLLAGTDSPLQQLPAEQFDVRLFAVGNGLRPLQPDQLTAVKPADGNTRIADALKELIQTTRGGPLESILLLTDGVDTTSEDPVAMAKFAASRGATVHTIGFGEKNDAPDVRILDAHAPSRVERGLAVDLNVLVSRGTVKTPLELRLYQDTQLLRAVPIPPSLAGEPVMVKIPFMPDREGSAKLSLEIPPAKGERNLANNKRDLEIQVRETRVEVLFVEGSPRHEYAFIRRAMADNRFFKVVTLLRVGKDQYYRYGDDSDAVSDGFPKTAEELGRFKAIILSDVESSFFTPAQIDLITDFVKNRGGGLLMVGGVNSFNLGGYQSTPLADLLPVTLAPAKTSPTFDDTEFQFQVTPAGADHEIVRLTADPQDNLAQWALMPPLRGFNPLYEAKPGAQVLAVRAGPQPAILLAVQNVGSGRSAAFAPANSWRWKMLRKSDDDTFRRFWTQMIRWLSVGAKEMLAVETDTRVAAPQQPISITANVLDKAHRPTNAAKVVARIKDPFGNVQDLELPWILREDGVYQAVYRPVEKGAYDIKITSDFAGQKLESETSFFVAELSNELLRPGMDADALAAIAQAGNGTVNLEGRTDSAIKAILASSDGTRKLLELVEERDLRDAPVLLLALLAVWFAEWIIRKRSALA